MWDDMNTMVGHLNYGTASLVHMEMDSMDQQTLDR